VAAIRVAAGGGAMFSPSVTRRLIEEFGRRGRADKTHVAHILSTLDLRDRTQAVVLAYESGLVRPGEAAV
jgi:hypothetical protein